MSDECAVVDINMVKSRMLIVRDQPVLLDRDVAALYGVQTKEINQKAFCFSSIMTSSRIGSQKF